ncbi:MAG: hypothetical protein EGR46_02120 [Ruminococcus sp.]|uniref:hypothetical protein n=1 Tax=Ruminococcus sp. TaxID=41978 RepID=UPI0025DB70C3|nr:hypothetical protein [Ruminococcus sp.]MBD9047728.1 hypothetical protein [Ruminococcus sp.]
MLKKFFSRNKASIGKNSNKNVILQNNTINNPTIMVHPNSDLITTLGNAGKYDAIQDIISSQLSAAKFTHPLFPDFSAKIDPQLNKLVSTPETKDAFNKYPKRIKGTYKLDYEKYPSMDKSETPWEYAFRTQTNVELETTSYREYLGDIEDPFPVTTYSEGMFTIITPPEFPESVDASIESGNISIPIKLRRLPCLEFGKIVFGNVSTGHGFNIKFAIQKGCKKAFFNIKKTYDGSLEAQLLREKLILNMQSNNIKIVVNDHKLMDFRVSDDELNSEIFKIAPNFIVYIENLISIQKKYDCHFDSTIKEITIDDYITSSIMSASIKNLWHLTRLKFDQELRCNYDHISKEVFNTQKTLGKLMSEISVSRISLQGVNFSADSLCIVYTDAKINNAKSVIKNIEKKKNNILITIKPLDGNKYFNKYLKFKNLKLSD